MKVTLLALLISLIALPGPWTQTTRVVRKQSIEGLSWSYLLFSSWSALVWITYGFVASSRLQIGLNASHLSAFVMIIGWACLNRPMPMWRSALSTAIFLAALLALAFIGPSAVGTCAVAMGIWARFPQIAKAWRDPGGVAVSIGAFTISGIASALWMLYAIVTHDSFVLASALFSFTYAIFVTVRTLQGRTIRCEEERNTPNHVALAS